MSGTNGSRELDLAQVDHVANLARLDITDEERRAFARQLGSILDYVDQLQALDTGHVDPTLGVQPRSNVFREDVPKPGLGREQALANAPHQEEGYFRMPRILEDS